MVATQSVPYGEDAELEGCVKRRAQFPQTGTGFWSTLTARSAALFDDRDERHRVKSDLYFRVNPVRKCATQMCSLRVTVMQTKATMTDLCLFFLFFAPNMEQIEARLTEEALKFTPLCDFFP